MGRFMPTTIRVANIQPRVGFLPELPSISNFLVIAMIQLTVILFSGGQYGSLGEQSFWW